MAVSRADKEAELTGLVAALSGADSAILLDYRGLKVPEATELRRKIRGAGGRYKVVKNTLALRAIKGTPFEALETLFVGTTGIAISGRDPVELAKTLTAFAKTSEGLKIKGAFVQGQTLKAPGVAELATLPGKPELYAQFLSVLQAPLVQIVSVLSAAQRDLVGVLAAYERKQSEGAS
ncbi:MAG: 50S ribosomal protein L10 [Vicinamibacterales bacterium]